MNLIFLGSIHLLSHLAGVFLDRQSSTPKIPDLLKSPNQWPVQGRSMRFEGVCTAQKLGAPKVPQTRGIWGHSPPENFEI